MLPACRTHFEPTLGNRGGFFVARNLEMRHGDFRKKQRCELVEVRERAVDGTRSFRGHRLFGSDSPNVALQKNGTALPQDRTECPVSSRGFVELFQQQIRGSKMKTVLNSDKQPTPESGFLRLPQVLEIFPVSASTWWAGCRSGRFPPGVKLSPRTTAWRASDIKTLLENPGMNWNDKES